ncbi:MAG: hypothetical protein KF830_14080 [Planctomycetes bacterium]|nr:hypothetical protein [Planctomycetota bacterium]
MKHPIHLLVLTAAATFGADLLAQSNSRFTGASPISSGYNGGLTSIGSATVRGRQGAAYPNGEMALSFQNNLCNPGGIPIEWRTPGGFVGSTIQTDHPKFGFMVAREVNGRLVQISDWSYCKHAFLSLNDPNCGSCTQPPAGGAQLGVGCSDIYSAANNASFTYLGPPWEINPFTGVWNGVGSYFDIGDPAQANFPQPADNVRSLSTSGWGNVKNRVTIQETDIQGGVSSGLFFMIHVIHEGEPIDNRGDNTMSRPFTLNWSGTAWTTATTGTPTLGSILTRWSGSTMAIGQNGGGNWNNTFDGRFAVAVKVTGPTNGLWHYEYAVHNIDNAGGGASFRLPVCPSARVLNLGFRDIDKNPLNDWTATVSGGEIVWNATAGNSHRWNQLFNFWFDSDAAPVAGNATIDQALLEPGAALSLAVATQVPGLQPAVHLGSGCGTPSLEFAVNGLPTIGNAGFGLLAQTGPGTPFLTLFSGPTTPFNLTPECPVFINLLGYGDLGLTFADGAGNAFVPIPIDPLWAPFDMTFQAATFVPAPPLFDLFGVSNGLTVRFGGTGCQ